MTTARALLAAAALMCLGAALVVGPFPTEQRLALAGAAAGVLLYLAAGDRRDHRDGP